MANNFGNVIKKLKFEEDEIANISTHDEMSEWVDNI